MSKCMFTDVPNANSWWFRMSMFSNLKWYLFFFSFHPSFFVLTKNNSLMLDEIYIYIYGCANIDIDKVVFAISFKQVMVRLVDKSNTENHMRFSETFIECQMKLILPNHKGSTVIDSLLGFPTLFKWISNACTKLDGSLQL